MWDFIYTYLKSNSSIEWIDTMGKISVNDIISKVIYIGQALQTKLPCKSKCSVLCNREINTAIGILACWYANVVPIPMAINYGEKNCDNIVNYTMPDMLISDDIILNTYNLPMYNIVENVFINETNIIVVGEANDLSDIAIIMCTSGTTGTPKGVMITEEGLIGNVINISCYFPVESNDKFLIVRPLYHCAVLTGEFLLSIFKGASIYFLNNIYNPFLILDTIEKNNINIMCGTPTLFNHLSELYNRVKRISKLKIIVLSGECLSKRTALKIRDSFPNTNIFNVYGLTEAAPRVSWLSPELFDDYPESVGIPLNETKIKIVTFDDYTKALPVNEKGIVFVKSPSIMKGYYDEIELSKGKLINGWLNTGDVGFVNEIGLLYICTRVDDMIIKAGMNIYPQEIENSIRQINIVEDIVAYGVKNNIGQSIAINVVLRESITKKQLLKNISDILPAYQMPDTLNIVDKIDKNVSGKTIRPQF